MLSFSITRGEETPAEVYAFRYAIYVEEMHRKQFYADHDARIIKDKLDAAGVQFVAREDGALAAVMRINNLRDGDIGEYFDLYQLSRYSAKEISETTIGTRLMSLKEQRKGAAPFGLFRSSCKWALNNGIRYCVLDCNDYLVKRFEMVGYYKMFDVDHPEYGLVSVVRIDLHDIDHQVKIGSPLQDICRRFLDTGSAGDPAEPFA